MVGRSDVDGRKKTMKLDPSMEVPRREKIDKLGT
jgi:hypothetical protein